MGLLPRITDVAMAWSWAVAPLALLLLAGGLLRSRLVPFWVPIIGVCAAVAYFVSSFNSGAIAMVLGTYRGGGVDLGTYLIGALLETTFLIALGVTLLWRGLRRPSSETGEA